MSLRVRVPLGPRDEVSGQHQEGFHKGDKGKPSNLRHDARSPGRRESAGAFRLCGAAGGFVHPAEFVFCGLPHEGEGQDVTGEDEGALPVPGGIGRASGEGRSRKARWEGYASQARFSLCNGVGSLYIYQFFFLKDLNTER